MMTDLAAIVLCACKDCHTWIRKLLLEMWSGAIRQQPCHSLSMRLYVSSHNLQTGQGSYYRFVLREECKRWGNFLRPVLDEMLLFTTIRLKSVPLICQQEGNRRWPLNKQSVSTSGFVFGWVLG